jgi:hypothetical protein
MDSIIRPLKIQELTARLFLYELENRCLSRDLASPLTSNDRRAEIHQRKTALENERRNAICELEWTQAEERLGRPDVFYPMSV